MRSLPRAAPSRSGDLRALAELFNNFGNVVGAAGDLSSYRTHAADALRIAEQLGDDELRLGLAADLSVVAWWVGDLEDATALVEPYLHELVDPRRGDFLDFPPGFQLLWVRANALMEMSLFRKAVEHLTLILEMDPGYPGLESTLGLALARNRDYGKAIPFFLKAIEKEPDNSSLYLNLGNTYLGIGQVEKAVEEYEKVLHYDPENLQAHHNLAYSYLELEDWENAISHFHKTLQINPDDASARDQLAMALRKSGKK